MVRIPSGILAGASPSHRPPALITEIGATLASSSPDMESPCFSISSSSTGVSSSSWTLDRTIASHFASRSRDFQGSCRQGFSYLGPASLIWREIQNIHSHHSRFVTVFQEPFTQDRAQVHYGGIHHHGSNGCMLRRRLETSRTKGSVLRLFNILTTPQPQPASLVLSAKLPFRALHSRCRINRGPPLSPRTFLRDHHP